MIPADLLIRFILAGVSEIPALVAKFEASAEATAEQKKALRELVKSKLDATNAAVQAVDVRTV